MKVTTPQIVTFVTDQWLETGKPLQPKQIAEGLKCSVSTIRKRLDEDDPISLDNVKIDVPRYEKNYNTFIGYTQGWAYQPSRAKLRAIIRRYRRDPRLADLKGELPTTAKHIIADIQNMWKTNKNKSIKEINEGIRDLTKRWDLNVDMWHEWAELARKTSVDIDPCTGERI